MRSGPSARNTRQDARPSRSREGGASGSSATAESRTGRRSSRTGRGPLPGQPTSETITTTRYAGDNATGTLTFQADPTQCNGSPGVTSAGIGGATFLTGP